MFKKFVLAMCLLGFCVSIAHSQGTISSIPSILDGEPSDRNRVWFAVDDLGLGKTRRLNLFHLGNLIKGPTVKGVADLASLQGLAEGTVVHVLGYTTTADGGEGFFYLDTSGQLGGGAADGGLTFNATGGTNWYWRRVLDGSRIITPYMFGGVNDATTDDATEIQAAADAAGALASTLFKPVLYFPSGDGWYVTDTINIPVNVIVKMDGWLIADVDQNEAGMVVGEATTRNTEISGSVFHVKRDVISDWSDEGSIGVQFINLDTSNIFCEVGGILGHGFTIGAQFIGWADDTISAGCAWNTVELGRFYNNKIAIDITNRSDSTGLGYASENLFLGGDIHRASNANTGESCYAIRITSQDGKYKLNSNNVFLRPSIELNEAASSPSEALPVLIEYGWSNKVISARNEINGPATDAFARIMPDYNLTASAEVHNEANDFSFIHTNAVLDDRSKRASSTKQFQSKQIADNRLKLVFDSGLMHKAAYPWTPTETHIPGLHAARSSGFSGDYSRERETSITVAADYVEYASSRAFGVNLDTSLNKQFLVTTDCESGFGGRVAVQCLNASGDVLESRDDFTVDSASDEITPDSGAHDWIVDDPVVFTTTGSLPGGLQLNTVYFIKSVTAAEFTISTTVGGATFDIDATAGSGLHTVTLHYFYAGGRAMGTTTSWGRSYTTGTDVNESTWFRVRNEVKTVNLLLAGGSGNIRIRRFQVFSLDPDASVLAEPGYVVTDTAAGITASTTQSQGEQPLVYEINEVTTVGTANDVVTLPPAQAGRPSCTVINQGANTLQVFPASGDDIDGGATDASVTIAAGSSATYRAVDGDSWYE